MTLPTGNRKSKREGQESGFQGFKAAGFTLIELILVMALLAIVLSVTFPSLQGFFRGRNLDSEAQRFLSLTRYGQSRAVAEGVPMVLWIDARQKTYGLQAAAGYLDTDNKAVDFALDEDVQVEVAPPVLATTLSQWTEAVPLPNSLPMMRFLPSAFMSESSPEYVLLRQDKDHALWIVQSPNRLNYEIRTDYTPNQR